MATFDAIAIKLTRPIASAPFAGRFSSLAFNPSFSFGYSKGFEAGALTAPDDPNPSAIVGFFASKLNGDPATGLIPTWHCYFNAFTGAPQAAPAISEMANGNYKFTASGSVPAGIIDLGPTCDPQYLAYSVIGPVTVFAAFDADGEPLPGLAPTWVSLKKASDNSNFTQPAITALGSGLYKVTRLAEHCVGTIDLGGTAFPRYVQYDSETVGTVVDPTPPTISVVSPTPGVAPGQPGGFPTNYEQAKETPIVVDIIDANPGVRYSVVIARFYGTSETSTPDEEVVYRRGQFRGKYVAGSYATSIANGVRLTVKRKGGWPTKSDGSMGHILFAIDSVDQSGNLV
jgi:hypothetical protein